MRVGAYNRGMKTTRHFDVDVIGPNRHVKYEGITLEICQRIVSHPHHSEASGEEMLFWGHAPELPGNTKWLKVVTNREADTLVSAYKDKGFAARVRREEV